MCPSIENQENPVRYLGQNCLEEDVFVLVLNLTKSGVLDQKLLASCLEKAADTIESVFPNAKAYYPADSYSQMLRSRFKWIGYQDRLVVFSEMYAHIDVRDVVLNKDNLIASAQGGGRLDVKPEGMCIYGRSGTLLDDLAFTAIESEKYKLEFLPTKLGREYFTYE